MQKRNYISAKGRKVDMEKLISMNEHLPAVGNMKVNARGDILGEGGKIIKTREEVLREHYRSTEGKN